jgi:hypothetical protein
VAHLAGAMGKPCGSCSRCAASALDARPRGQPLVPDRQSFSATKNAADWTRNGQAQVARLCDFRALCDTAPTPSLAPFCPFYRYALVCDRHRNGKGAFFVVSKHLTLITGLIDVCIHNPRLWSYCQARRRYVPTRPARAPREPCNLLSCASGSRFGRCCVVQGLRYTSSSTARFGPRRSSTPALTQLHHALALVHDACAVMQHMRLRLRSRITALIIHEYSMRAMVRQNSRRITWMLAPLLPRRSVCVSATAALVAQLSDLGGT